MEVGAGAAGTVCDWKEVRADGFVRLEAWKEREESHVEIWASVMCLEPAWRRRVCVQLTAMA